MGYFARCTECGWEGDLDELESDVAGEDEDGVFGSFARCPECGGYTEDVFE